MNISKEVANKKIAMFMMTLFLGFVSLNALVSERHVADKQLEQGLLKRLDNTIQTIIEEIQVIEWGLRAVDGLEHMSQLKAQTLLFTLQEFEEKHKELKKLPDMLLRQNTRCLSHEVLEKAQEVLNIIQEQQQDQKRIHELVEALIERKRLNSRL